MRKKETLFSERRVKDAIFNDVLVIQRYTIANEFCGVEECPCGAQKQWWCSISNYGVNLFSGIACGEMEYILSVYPASQGYIVDCSGGLVCTPMRI